jgi:hypothetical protein
MTHTPPITAGQNGCLAKPVLGARFTISIRLKCTFLKLAAIDGFLAPHAVYLKKKKFHLMEEALTLFESWRFKCGKNN